MYQWQQIKTCSGNGMSIKAMARKMGVSKNTIRKYLRSKGVPEMKPRLYGSHVNPFKEEVGVMIKNEFIGTRIFNELLALGFKGSLSSVHRYLKKHRPSVNREKMSSRFETEAGKQMQYDWKEWALDIGGAPTKIYVHSLILSFSRKKFYVASLNITTSDILQAIHQGMTYFGGFGQELVIDNPKQMVLSHGKNGVIRYNDAFLRFCGLFGISPNPCENYRPQTKGKVERPFLVLQEHFLKGLAVTDWSDLSHQLEIFTSTVNHRYHSGIETTPDHRFEIEKPMLCPIPCVEPSAWRVTQLRKISQDGYVSLDGKRYPVPMNLCGKEVVVESLFGTSFRVMRAGVLVCELAKRLEGPTQTPHPEHAMINAQYEDSRHKRRSVPVIEFIRLFGDQGESFLDGLKKTQKENLYFHIDGILMLTQFYQLEDILTVLKDCIEIQVFHKNTVKNLLGSKSIKFPIATPCLSISIPSASISRPLSAYKEVARV